MTLADAVGFVLRRFGELEECFTGLTTAASVHARLTCAQKLTDAPKMFLSRVIEKLGVKWPVIGFDTFGGSPPRRSPLDVYNHQDCVFTDLAAVRRYLDGRDIEIVLGDIVNTSMRLEKEVLVLSFIDTDNYSSAAAAIKMVTERTVVGGAIVFDHFTGIDRFRYTLGKRMAGSVLLDDPRYFHLYGTGVFYRQCLTR